eukprot:TRINITY_DN1180_c0_g2_i2.p1 TRINITY_DN1180_c0_g2~~TRINITY_DN1180_c0_g2_i2.p1  ORF type:complete len:694 (+),score=80.45 TRINITY_DN1180_c0_g2_i2:76-2157(+)
MLCRDCRNSPMKSTFFPILLIATKSTLVDGIQVAGQGSDTFPRFPDVIEAAARVVRIFSHGSKGLVFNVSNVSGAITLYTEPQEPRGAFVDVSGHAFPPEWYAWNHVGFPRRYACTPTFPDLDGDGVLDFFYHNHFQQYPESDWDLGISKGTNTVESGEPFFTNATSAYIMSTEIPDTPWTRVPADMHNVAFLDIDRDGLLDMYISTGGGMGMDHGPAKNPLLLWGEQSTEPGESLPRQRFRGGRNMVEASNLTNVDSRGRFTYFADFNRDGLLDLVFANDVRVDADNRFGYAMFNKGGRVFEPDYGLAEYASTMVLHDADGDGHAEEFVVHRTRCLPASVGDSSTPITPDEARLAFCEVRPQGSTAIFKYDAEADSMALISPVFTRSEHGDHAVGRSMQTGDFDGDAIADLAILFDDCIIFHLSSKRGTGTLPVGNTTDRLDWSRSECSARGFRVGDLNLDGRQDIVVMCNQAGAHLVYLHEIAHNWVKREGNGDLNSVSLAGLKAELLPEGCALETRPVYLRGFCESLQNGSPLALPTPYGISLVDWNNDGFLDIILTHDVGSMMMLKNNFFEAAGNKRFIAFRLVGNESNAYGIGATVLLTARGMNMKKETTVQLREVYSASHDTDWWGTRDDRLIFGLGKTGVPITLTVRWPGKSKYEQVIEGEEAFIAHVNNMKSPMIITEPVPSALQ